MLHAVKPTAEEILEGREVSHMNLTSPTLDVGDCVRYDIAMVIPPGLRNLYIHSRSTTQIRFDPMTEKELAELAVYLTTTDSRNMLLPTQNIRAKSTKYSMAGGWITGSATILDKVVVDTEVGDANTRLYVQQSLGHSDNAAILETLSGNGHTEIFYDKVITPGQSEGAQRPIRSIHRAGHGDMSLIYRDIPFNGKISIHAKYLERAKDLPVLRKGSDISWLGRLSGRDEMYIFSSGSVDLYFA
ncbi:hypothetical protein K474DRAFT_1669111 [Panus rudis PR-1116 ss-1]|nr:hypothetical protein K474DRAFT_1669111 [Panus rudis PR-1116 ss-1]